MFVFDIWLSTRNVHDTHTHTLVCLYISLRSFDLWGSLCFVWLCLFDDFCFFDFVCLFVSLCLFACSLSFLSFFVCYFVLTVFVKLCLFDFVWLWLFDIVCFTLVVSGFVCLYLGVFFGWLWLFVCLTLVVWLHLWQASFCLYLNLFVFDFVC